MKNSQGMEYIIFVRVPAPKRLSQLVSWCRSIKIERCGSGLVGWARKHLDHVPGLDTGEKQIGLPELF
jgi:hypothetical protein